MGTPDSAFSREKRKDSVLEPESLADILSTELLQHLQDLYLSELGLPLLFVQPDGSPITVTECPEEFALEENAYPITVGGAAIGYLLGACGRKKTLIRGACGLARIVSELASSELRNRSQRYIDPVTGLINRTHFWAIAEEEIKSADLHNCPVSFLLIDLDDFRSVNDAFGHAVGDKLLRLVGHVLRTGVRASDLASRYAGDSFLILLKCAGADGAELVGWRLKNSLEKCVITSGGETVSVAASFGHVTYPNCAGRDMDSIYKEARAALERNSAQRLKFAA